MKLLREMIDQKPEYLVETSDSGKKSKFVHGIFLMGEMKNRNGRIYPGHVLSGAVNNYHENYITKAKAMGELNHPDGPAVNLERACIIIKELKADGNNYLGKAKVTESTPMGSIVGALLDEGAAIGVSSRAMGSLKEQGGAMYVQPDLVISAIDVVSDPSAPDAWVRGVMENASWVYDETHGWKMAEAANEVKHQMQQMSVKQINEAKLSAFEKWLKTL